MKLEDLAAQAKAMGIQAIDLLNENEWDVVKKAGLICSTSNGPGGITEGWNRPANNIPGYELMDFPKRVPGVSAHHRMPQ